MTRLSRKKLWLPAAAVALVLIIAWWGASASIGYRSRLRCCVFDPGTGGALGVTIWARDLGFPVRALQDPLWEAVGKADFREGNCFLTAGDGPWSPWGEELSQEQWGPIRSWIARGNSLIVITTDPARLPKAFVKDVFDSSPEVHLRPTDHSAPTASEEEPSFFSSSVREDPPTSTVAIPTKQSLSVRADGPRWSKMADRGETAADERGVVWFRQTLGKRALYVLLDDFAWTNSGFDRKGNADTLAALLTRELRGGVFGFDEYRHGHGRVESFSAYLLGLPGSGAFCLIALLLAGLYLLGRNVRFGPPQPFVFVERRTVREYVEAAAFLNQRARAAPLALESIVRRIRFVGLRRGPMHPDLQELLRQGERFIAGGARPANPSEVCALVRKLIACRKRHYGA